MAGWKEKSSGGEAKKNKKQFKKKMLQLTKRQNWEDLELIILSVLTADCEGATRQHFPLVVLQGVVALVCLCHLLGHPHLAAPLQSTATDVAGLSVRPVPQHNRHRHQWGTAGGKFQQGAIFRDMVLKVFTIVSVVRLDAFWGRMEADRYKQGQGINKRNI